MKKLLGIIVFFLLWNSVFSQIYLPVTPKDYGANFNRLKANLVLHIPVAADTVSLNTTDTSAQLRVYQGQLYYHYGTWKQVGKPTPTLQQVYSAGTILTQDNSIINTGHTLGYEGGTLSLTDVTQPSISHTLTNTSFNLTDNRFGLYNGGINMNVINKSFFTTFWDAYNKKWIDFGVDTVRGFYVGADVGTRYFQVDTAGKIYMPNLATGTGANVLYLNGNQLVQGAAPSGGGGSQNLQQVTTLGNTTTLSITTAGYNSTANPILLHNGKIVFYRGNPVFYNNLAIGGDAFVNNTTGKYNVSVGDTALFANTTGSWNVGLGYFSGQSNTTGSQNTSVGDSTLSSNVIGSFNTAIGWGALKNNNYSYSTAIGAFALYNATGGGSSYNVAVGYNSMGAATTALSNSAFGNNSLAKVTTGQYNTGLGAYAGYRIGTGSYNIAIGYAPYQASSGQFTTLASGIHNVAIGMFSLNEDSTGSFNIAIGRSAGTHAQGSWNTYIGDSTAFQSYTGDDNTVIGSNAMNGTGVHYDINFRNTVIGKNAGYHLGGVGNTVVGWSAGYNSVTTNHSIIIGDSVQWIPGAGDYQINIGNRIYSRDQTHIGIMNNNPQATLDVTGDVNISGTLTLASITANLDFPNTSGNSNSDLTVNYAGAADGDVVSLGISNTAVLPGCVYMAWVSAPGVVTIRLANMTPGAEDPPAANFKIRVVK